MTKKLIFLSFIVLSILISSTLINLDKAKATSLNVQEFSNQFISENAHFTPLINFKEFKITYKEILIKADVSNSFVELNHAQQFGFLSSYVKHLRYYLRTELKSPHLRTKSINIICKTKDQTYKLTNCIPDKKVEVKSDSELYIDNKLILGSKEHKILMEQYLHKNPQFDFIDQDIEIIRYATKLFNKLTVGGNYYNHKKDSKVILDLVTEKFGITEQEYSNIYKKYFFLFE
ncbi:hypothetical protein [Bacillus massiliigorillae]|uniref:hypothetical protein n=1 Tax=Bacillus massiliigorillae TaxID=1243664 RepID=UPI0003A42ECD|nr:hypothetical protein [Bacillus massiliigorillae]